MKQTSFMINGKSLPVAFIETIQVKDGVECDVFAFEGDSTKDLAIVKVTKGHSTPRQKVLMGNKTTEGFLSGKGKFVVEADGNKKLYEFEEGNVYEEVTVSVGEIMQWSANNDTDLVFYEICEPPYKDGRFENLPEANP